MKRKWKIWIAVIGLLVIAGGVFAGAKYSQRGIVAVQTGVTFPGLRSHRPIGCDHHYLRVDAFENSGLRFNPAIG